jgi:hypothetical protein
MQIRGEGRSSVLLSQLVTLREKSIPRFDIIAPFVCVVYDKANLRYEVEFAHYLALTVLHVLSKQRGSVDFQASERKHSGPRWLCAKKETV